VGAGVDLPALVGGAPERPRSLAAEEGEGVVVVRVTYSYTPVFFDFLLGQTTLEETTVLRPRRSTIVEGPES